MQNSIQIPQGEVVLLEAKKVTQFVEVGGTNLLGKGFRVTLGQIPKIPQIKDDSGGWIRGGWVGLDPTGALEESEQIRFKTLLEDCRIRDVLIESHDGFRGGTQLGGEPGADPFYGCRGEAMKIGLDDTRLRTSDRSGERGKQTITVPKRRKIHSNAEGALGRLVRCPS